MPQIIFFIITSNQYLQTHPESLAFWIKPVTHTSSLLVVTIHLLMLSSLYDTLNFTFLPSFKGTECCLSPSALPKRVQKVVTKVCLLKYQVVFWMPFALMVEFLLEPCFHLKNMHRQRDNRCLSLSVDLFWEESFFCIGISYRMAEKNHIPFSTLFFTGKCCIL